MKSGAYYKDSHFVKWRYLTNGVADNEIDYVITYIAIYSHRL